MRFRFVDLSKEQHEEVNAIIRAMIVTETERGMGIIKDESKVRAKMDRQQLTDGALATYFHPPIQLGPSWERDRNCLDGEILVSLDGQVYFFSHNHATTYFATRAQWGARARVIEYLQTLGFTVEAAEAELYRWFVPTYGVATLLMIDNKGTNEVLVGFRSEAVGSNHGMLTLPGGFVQPDESLEAAALRELQQEGDGSMPVRFMRGVSWGSHNVAPANLTFVLRACGGLATIHPCAEWKGNAMQRVTLRALHEAVCDDNYRRLESELNTKRVTIAPDVIKPLRVQLEVEHRCF